MKKVIGILIVASVILSGAIATSCKKKTKNPDYPQLVGAWKGTTSQAYPIQVNVENLNGDLYVTYVYFKYSRTAGDSAILIRSNTEGLAMLSGTSFMVVMDGAPPTQTLVQGTFRTDTLKLNGTFTGYTTEPPVSPVTGTYTAFRSK
jgi:hypothetical protein